MLVPGSFCILHSTFGIVFIRFEWGAEGGFEIIPAVEVAHGILVGFTQELLVNQVEHDLAEVSALPNAPGV